MRFVVVGDIILDEYLYGSVIKKNPHYDNSNVIRIYNKLFMPGGASKVADYLSANNHDTVLLGVVGNDINGNIINNLWNYDLIADDSRVTTTKTRFIVNNELYGDRLDFECGHNISDQVADELINRIYTNNAILIEDYGKGVCTLKIIEACLKRSKFVCVDPALGRDWDDYSGVNLIKCNAVEAAFLANKNVDELHTADYIDLAAYLYQKHNAVVVITIGKAGIVAFDGNRIFAPPCIVDVRNESGAGDIVFASLVSSLVLGMPLLTACSKACTEAAKAISKLNHGQVKPICPSRLITSAAKYK